MKHKYYFWQSYEDILGSENKQTSTQTDKNKSFETKFWEIIHVLEYLLNFPRIQVIFKRKSIMFNFHKIRCHIRWKIVPLIFSNKGFLDQIRVFVLFPKIQVKTSPTFKKKKWPQHFYKLVKKSKCVKMYGIFRILRHKYENQ